MYSETAGLSYENPEFPDDHDDQATSAPAEPEPELRRVVSYPDGPGDPVVPAGQGDAPLNGPGAAVPGPPPTGPPAYPPATGGPMPPAPPGPSGEPQPAGLDALLDDGEDDAFDGRFDIGPLDDGAPRDDAGPFDDEDDELAPPAPAAPPPAAPRPAAQRPAAPRPGSSGAPAPGRNPFRVPAPVSTAGGEQPRRQRVLDITMDARMRFWRERAIVMVIVGLLFGLLTGNWIIGLTLAILAGIGHAVWRSRTIASIPPGIKLSREQRLTQRKLGRMERAGYRALNARPIPGSEDVIDHLVIGPSGVYAIDSERWDKRLPIRVKNGRQLWIGPQSQKARLDHAKSEAGRASELLSASLGREIAVRAALAIYGPKIPWDIVVIREVDVFNGDRLSKYLKRRSRAREVARLSREEVARIYDAAEEVLPFGFASATEVTPVG
ncbi:MAG TPA: nuclease-related domain-containing protein [Trebonia sp.]|jgi:hypothetical protein|nr:nuclease-related domain-containing protein [Trebonia sp.]